MSRDTLESIEGDVPDLANQPSGCRFHPRCPYATDSCVHEEPLLVDKGGAHQAACHYTDEIKSKRGVIEAPLKYSA